MYSCIIDWNHVKKNIAEMLLKGEKEEITHVFRFPP